ncbi:DUF5675 family protein [Galbibacter sp. EGI 63066]|uniref:DUF5675 family protein n=1 Tax=Galbibacter sp. EGI 63066 TaxID=2993559 RepID=UPI0022491770|nr:DUF5675 family protein [Galbibacter sp. EGI 63066]MCX2680665.1 DUF5675 family protein [Galbibacter sp. EGI 63066]
MELVLLRTHFKESTIGALYYQGDFICFTIELPWKENRRNISCIPDGCYPLTLRTTHRFGPHFKIGMVPDRDGILIHPANNAPEELRGCIAPVSQLTGMGKGVFSKTALDRLFLYYERSRKLKEGLFLRIVSKAH